MVRLAVLAEVFKIFLAKSGHLACRNVSFSVSGLSNKVLLAKMKTLVLADNLDHIMAVMVENRSDSRS